MKTRLMRPWHLPVATMLAASLSIYLACNRGMDSSTLSQTAASQSSQMTQVFIEGYAGTPIRANVYLPSSRRFVGNRPAVIFINSWCLNQWEYDGPARQLAADGYVVLSYQTRGFGESGGLAGVGSLEDLEDAKNVLTWLQANAPVDGPNVAIGGVSYGAGIGLLAAGHDPRIKTVFALSGWTDLEQAIAGGETVHQVWLNLLIATGNLTGRLSPEIELNAQRVRDHKEIPAMRLWASVRSPRTYVETLNSRKIPIFMANSYQDNLFTPVGNRPFYDDLIGPKHFYVEYGMHASSELPGLIGLPTGVWTEVRRWLDYWLRGEDTGIMREPAVSLDTEHGREYFAEFPQVGVQNRPWRLRPLNDVIRDSDDPESTTSSDGAIKIRSGRDTLATSGVPILSEITEAFLRAPILTPLGAIDRRHAAVYVSEPLAASLVLRGAPVVRIPVAPHAGPQQLVAYIYDVDNFTIGTLLGHGVITKHEAEVMPYTIELPLSVTARDIRASHRLAIAIDTQDPLFQKVSDDTFDVKIQETKDHGVELLLPQ